MKKILCSMFLAILMLCGAASCFAAEQDTYLIYSNEDFEDHRVGELPAAFNYHWYTGNGFYAEEEMRREAYYNTEVVELEKDGNSENKAVRLNPDLNLPEFDLHQQGSDYSSTVRSIFTHYPMKEKGVISFSFMVTNTTTKKVVKMGRNAITSIHLTYVDNRSVSDERYISSNWRSFVEITGGKAYYTGNGSVELGTVEANKWYNIDFTVDIEAGTGKVYFNGTPNDVNLPANTCNIYEVRFDLPKVADDVWYIDDLCIYEADGLVEEAVLDAAWKKYTDSSFYSGYEFESSRATSYDYMAFLKCDGKRFSIMNTNRIFDGSKIQSLPTKIYYKDDVVMVPVIGMAEILGATTSRDASTGEVTVNYNDKTIKFVPESETYYVNGKPAKLRYAAENVDDTVCVQIDVLFGLLEETYLINGEILWIDRPTEYDWHMPLGTNGKELGGLNENTLNEDIDRRILKMFLYDRPTDAEIQTAMTLTHPRIEFTAESVAEIKDRINPNSENYDEELAALINSKITSANNLLNTAEDQVYAVPDGKRIDFDVVGGYFEKWAFAYLFNDDAAKKAEYKAAILHHMDYLKNTEKFRDWGIQYNYGLDTGIMAYGFAYAYDWVDWSESERAMFEEACRRNITDHALHAYTCKLNYYHHSMCYSEGNIALISNSGVALLASALYERNPEYYSDVIRGALRASEGGTIAYFPYGEYSEGVSYWRYAETYLPRLLKGMQTSMNTDWGITDVPGIIETAEFPLKMRGAKQAYAFGDGQPENANRPIQMFAASQTNDKSLAEYRKQNGDGTFTHVDVANWVFDTKQPEGEGMTLDNTYEEDIYHHENATVILKSGWAESDTSVALHGGANNDEHGHFDIGTFQFDMNGVRFGVDLEREDYNLRIYGHTDVNKVEENYPKDIYPNGSPYTGAHYYRTKGEGHNTVVANLSVINAKKLYNADGTCNYATTGTYDMKGSAKSEFTDMKFGDEVSYAKLNMTETNDILSCAIRGVKLDKVNNIIEIQDDFAASTETDFLWSMHTRAQIDVAADGKSAILTQNGKKIKATILNDCDLKFENLPAEFDTTYGSEVKPLVETPNTGIRKLAVRTAVGKNITRFRLSVAIQPYDSKVVPKYVPMETWKNK